MEGGLEMQITMCGDSVWPASTHPTGMLLDTTHTWIRPQLAIQSTVGGFPKRVRTKGLSTLPQVVAGGAAGSIC
jgi:hypothetical protein